MNFNFELFCEIMSSIVGQSRQNNIVEYFFTCLRNMGKHIMHQKLRNGGGKLSKIVEAMKGAPRVLITWKNTNSAAQFIYFLKKKIINKSFEMSISMKK